MGYCHRACTLFWGTVLALLVFALLATASSGGSFVHLRGNARYVIKRHASKFNIAQPRRTFKNSWRHCCVGAHIMPKMNP